MTYPVVWVEHRALCWDQEMLDQWLSGPDYTHHIDYPPESADGCILVVPARYRPPEQVQDMIDPLSWVVLILTSDEESTFDHRLLSHPNMELWVMTPRPGRHEPGTRYLPEGARADTSQTLTERASGGHERRLDVFFAGQATHARRDACVAACLALPETVRTEVLPTEGFLKGIDRDDYLAIMAETKIAPCPAGAATPDSFRLYEALEAGALPIADGLAPRLGYREGYWHLLFPEGVPFPVITDWAELPKFIEHGLAGYPANATRAQAWWLRQKRRYRLGIRSDAARLSGRNPQPTCADDLVTVIIPTSPIPAHPSTQIIEDTVASVREQLPYAEIIVCADGVRPEQEDRRADYEQYLNRLTWLCAHEWTDVVPLVFDHHAHQANLTRAALDLVQTELVLFVEHDTPMCGHIPWDACAGAIRSGFANLIRFHHEAHVLEPHQHLMLDREPRDVNGVPMLRTVQWSQRPHLASAGFYRSIIETYFAPESRTMIEDVMHGVVQTAWNDHGMAGWQQFRMWMYAPDGDMKRSLHADGRGADPKFDMVFAYPGKAPRGAPR